MSLFSTTLDNKSPDCCRGGPKEKAAEDTMLTAPPDVEREVSCAAIKGPAWRIDQTGRGDL